MEIMGRVPVSLVCDAMNMYSDGRLRSLGGMVEAKSGLYERSMLVILQSCQAFGMVPSSRE